MDEMKWYVLRAIGGKEKKAAEYLQKEIERSNLTGDVAQILVPVKKEIVIKNNKRVVADRLLYPGYVLIECNLSPRLENIIRNLVPGISGFVSEKKAISGTAFEYVPIPVRSEEIQRILGLQDENAGSEIKTVVNYSVGESVKIIDGPFSGFTGTIEEILEDRSKVKVIVVIFGRKTALELSFTQVTKE